MFIFILMHPFLANKIIGRCSSPYPPIIGSLPTALATATTYFSWRTVRSSRDCAFNRSASPCRATFDRAYSHTMRRSRDRWNGFIFFLTFVVANGVVVNLTPKTFERVVKNNAYAIVAFCVPSARSCKAFMPEFRDASKEMDSYTPKIRFATMNTDIYSSFAEQKRIVNRSNDLVVREWEVQGCIYWWKN